MRPEPLRGRKPSTTNRPVGSPLPTRALIAADGPGTTSTRWPAAAAAATRSSPGSEMPGMPASVTITTRSPDARRRSTSATAHLPVWSLATMMSGALTAMYRRGRAACRSDGCPRRRWCRPQRRAASTARGDRSPRLPIGVATSTSDRVRPTRASSGSSRSRRLLDLDPIARFEGYHSARTLHGLGLDHRAERLHTRHPRQPAGRLMVARSTTTVWSPSRKATSMANRMPHGGVHLTEPVTPASLGSRLRSRRDRGGPCAGRLPAESATLAAASAKTSYRRERAGHVVLRQTFQTLNLISIVSPSATS